MPSLGEVNCANPKNWHDSQSHTHTLSRARAREVDGSLASFRTPGLSGTRSVQTEPVQQVCGSGVHPCISSSTLSEPGERMFNGWCGRESNKSLVLLLSLARLRSICMYIPDHSFRYSLDAVTSHRNFEFWDLGFLEFSIFRVWD